MLSFCFNASISPRGKRGDRSMKRQASASRQVFNTFNNPVESNVRIRGPLVRWRRGDARNVRVAISSADDSDRRQSPRLHLSIYTILSRRSVRRHNAVAARAFVAIHTDDVASLLP
ncbi:conserved hypothetical protein [Burkholderia diffusa]|nr:conserved hypothetical protein [Burkholderia diffusa]